MALEHEEGFVPVIDGKVWYYGGDQAWFGTSLRRCSACGTVAAANIMAYRWLYGRGAGHRGYSREGFLRHMNRLYEFVKPIRLPFVSEDAPVLRGFAWSFGVWPLGRFVRGVIRYGRARGEKLRPMRFDRTGGTGETFICKALLRDVPVALLLGNTRELKGIEVRRPDGSAFVQESFSRHWVVVTAIRSDADGAKIKVSTWGGSAWLDLSKCFRTVFLSSEMCCFL